MGDPVDDPVQVGCAKNNLCWTCLRALSHG